MKGKVFIFGDDIDTDVIAPGGVLHKGIDEVAKHSMEALVPDFHVSVKSGDVLIAGGNFGCGSSREQAPIVLKEMGINLVLARTFSRLFFRNAINVGLNVGILKSPVDLKAGDTVEYSIEKGELESLDGKTKIEFDGPTGILSEIISDGGLIEFVRKQIGKDRNY